MRELVKSVNSFSWAVSMLGARQLIDTARHRRLPALPPLETLNELEDLTQLAERRLDGPYLQAFEAGDRLQRSVVDLAFGCLRPTAESRRLGELTANVVQQSSSLLRGFLS